MDIDGITIIRKQEYSVFYIDNLSDELKSIIRGQLQGIYHGFSEIDITPDFYSYKNTIKSFLDRYESKAEDTKKGMIGELLTHILLNHMDYDFKSLSILKNKEERSIKKGFDIIYCHIDENKLWYTEVKSGKSDSGTSSDYNSILLKRAKDGIEEMFTQNLNSRWESALIDVTLTIKQNEGLVDLKTLLANDSPSAGCTDKKNVILVSVLYHPLTDQIIDTSINDFYIDTHSSGVFAEVMLISIQKATFDRVAQFLRDELIP